MTGMTNNEVGKHVMKTKNDDLILQNKVFLWVAAVTGLILLIPFVAMQFTNQVDWSIGDFVVMGILLFGIGSSFILSARYINKKYWPIVGAAFLLAFLYIWAELAVGIFTNLGS